MAALALLADLALPIAAADARIADSAECGAAELELHETVTVVWLTTEVRPFATGCKIR